VTHAAPNEGSVESFFDVCAKIQDRAIRTLTRPCRGTLSPEKGTTCGSPVGEGTASDCPFSLREKVPQADEGSVEAFARSLLQDSRPRDPEPSPAPVGAPSLPKKGLPAGRRWERALLLIVPSPSGRRCRRRMRVRSKRSLDPCSKTQDRAIPNPHPPRSGHPLPVGEGTARGAANCSSLLPPGSKPRQAAEGARIADEGPVEAFVRALHKDSRPRDRPWEKAVRAVLKQKHHADVRIDRQK